MRHVILVWYTWLSALSQGYVFSIGEWSDGLALAPASAVLFGLIAAASPCQLTTNLAALAYAAREFPRGATFSAALAYAAGKVSVYMVVGVLVVVASFQLQAHSVPVVVVARKLLGARMVLVGLGMLGDVDADRLRERGIGGQQQLGGCPGHGRRELHGGRGDAIRAAVRDAHDDSLGTHVDVGQNAELLGGGDDRGDEVCRVGEGGRGEDGLRACPCDTPVGDAPRPVELGRGDPV